MLPDPIVLFVFATIGVMVVSAIGTRMQWSVQPVQPRLIAEGGGIELVPAGCSALAA